MPNYVKNVLTISGSTPKRFDEIASFVRSDEYTFDFEKIIPTPSELMITDCSSGTTLANYYLHFCTPESEYYPILGIPKDTFNLIGMTEAEWIKFGSPETENPEKYLSDYGKELLQRFIPLYDCMEVLDEKEEIPALLLGYHYAQNQLFYGCQTWYKWRIEKWGTKWNAMESELLPEGCGWRFLTAWGAPFSVIETLSKIFPDALFTLKYADEDFGVNCGTTAYHNGATVYIYNLEERSEAAINFANRLWDGERNY